MVTFHVKGKKVVLESDGNIKINGVPIDLRQVSRTTLAYYDINGKEQRELRGKVIKKALIIKKLV